MFDCRTRVQLLINLNDIYFWNRVEKAGQKVYLVVVQYVTQKGLESSEWAGKMKSIHQAIKINGARVEKKLGEKIAGVEKNIAEVRKEISGFAGQLNKMMEVITKLSETKK